MTTPLLVFTGDVAFGELMRQCLEETGGYRVLLAHNELEVISYLQKVKPQLAFLDATHKIEKTLELGSILRRLDRNIQFIIISNSGWQSALEELTPHGYISKPFDLPDLLSLLRGFFALSSPPDQPHILEPEAQAERASSGLNLKWLEDVNRAAQHLTRLTLESSAQAALITRDDTLWAYAGQLPQAAANELVAALSRYWDRQGGGDLLRFTRLNTTKAEHMLYATQLARGMVLALIFDAETSFSTIRSQANNLVQSLSVLPPDAVKVVEAEDEPDEDEIDLAPLADILGSVPSPKPQQERQVPPAIFSDEDRPVRSSPTMQPANTNHNTSPIFPSQPVIDIDQEQEEPARDEEIENAPEPEYDTRKIAAQPYESDELAETRPHPVAERARRIVLEPFSPSLYNLPYACVLIPRFPHHYLTGDLRDRLSGWIPNTSIAYGWRLEHLAIRPDYILWTVNVPPATAPGYLMRIYRQQTSAKIFVEFSRLKEDNPGGDFWAPGSLILSGSQLPSDRLINEFIEQARHQQGIS